MSGGREPSVGGPYGEYPASGQESDQSRPMSGGLEPALGTADETYPARDQTGGPGGIVSVIFTPYLVPDADDLTWQERALCAQTDPEAFFPEKGGSTREAKKVCRSCEVRNECLEYALAHDERFGIWGGMSERERRRLKREAG